MPPEGNRTQVSLEAIPDHVENAVLAAEDREFWTNSGFSFTGFARAVIGQLTGNDSAGGGSTVTQQYVKTRWWATRCLISVRLASWSIP